MRSLFLYLLDCVAWFLCSTSFLTYRLSGWTLQELGAPRLGVLAHSSFVEGVRDPPLPLGDATGGKPYPYAEGVNTLCLYSRVPFTLLMKQSPPWHSGIHLQGTETSLHLQPLTWVWGPGCSQRVSCWLHLQGRRFQSLSQVRTLNDSLQGCVACQEEPEVYTSYLIAAMHSVFYIVLLRLR